LSFRVVASEAEFRDALTGFAPDVLLCDVAERNAGHVAALGIVHEMKLDLPVILVADAIGERGVVAALRGGAVDYVLKGNLVRLPSAVEHAVRESRAKAALERSLRAAEERLVVHARRLEMLWRIASDPHARGAEQAQALMSASAAALCAPQRFRGFLTRIDGPDLTVLAVTPDGDDNGRHLLLYPVGGRLAIETTSALSPLRTQYWSPATAANLPPASRALGWRSEITTRFEAAGARYVLTFGSAAAAEFGPDDVAFVEVLADALAHKLAFEAFEQTLRGSEARARSHAERLEALARVGTEPGAHGAERWTAMLREAASAIRVGHAFEGIFSRVDGATVVALAAVLPAPNAGGGGPEAPLPPDFPLEETLVGELLAGGGHTQAWDDIRSSSVHSHAAKERGWRAVIATSFSAAGKTYALIFGSTEPAAEPFRPFEHAYVEVLAAFFAWSLQAPASDDSAAG
jgi:CheY-like chemotaxis protein